MCRRISRQIVFTGILIALLAVFAGCEKPEPAPKQNPLPVLGKDPVEDMLVTEDHSTALARWAEAGIQNGIVVNIDTHDDMRFIPDEKIQRLRELYQARDWKGLENAGSAADSGLYHVGNWIYAAARLGIVGEVYWVIPFNHFSQKNADELLRTFLRENMFSNEDIETFSIQDYRFHGTFRGIPLVLCDIESLPAIKKPVLMSVDADFFPVFSKYYRINYLSALDRLFSALFNRAYRLQAAVVSYSVNGEYLQPHLRWVGTELSTVLKRPAVLNEPPSDLLAVLQEADNAYRSMNSAELFRITAQYRSEQPVPSLLLYRSYAHMLRGDYEQSLADAGESCKADTRLCTGLPYLGSVYAAKGRCKEAEQLFSAGYRADPEMRNGLYYYANCLRELGKTAEALETYNKDVARNGSFPTDFLIFETHLLADDNEAAIVALWRAVEGLERNPYAKVINSKAAQAVYVALDYSKKHGLGKLTARLEAHPAVQKMFVDYPLEGENVQ